MIRVSGISAAINGVIEVQGAKSVRELLDDAKSTFGDGGTDIRAWACGKLIEAGAAYPEVKRAIVDAMDGASPRARPGDATRDAFGMLISGNKTLAGLATDLADGTLSPAEAIARLPELRAHLEQVRRLILDAEAVATCAGQFGGRQ